MTTAMLTNVKRPVVRRELPPDQRSLRESESFVGNNVRWDNPNGASCLRHVKILGSHSVNRRLYTNQAKQGALQLYEDCNVNIDHPSVPNTNRQVGARFGWLSNVQLEGEDLFGDLHYNPKHPLAESIRWWAENRPQALGLSHNAVGQGKEENGVFIVEKIVTVRSVDLVADPATTRGLYESVSRYIEEDEIMPPETPPSPTPPSSSAPPATSAPSVPPSESHNEKVGALVSDIVNNKELSKAEKRKKLLQATHLLDDDEVAMEAMQNFLNTLKASQDPRDKAMVPLVEAHLANRNTPVPAVAPVTPATAPAAVPATPAATTPAPTAIPTATKTAREVAEEIQRKLKEERARVSTDLATVQATNLKDTRLATAKKLCTEAKLPDALQTELLMETLVECKDEARMKAVIQNQMVLAGLNRTKNAPLMESTKLQYREPPPDFDAKKVAELIMR